MLGDLTTYSCLYTDSPTYPTPVAGISTVRPIVPNSSHRYLFFPTRSRDTLREMSFSSSRLYKRNM